MTFLLITIFAIPVVAILLIIALRPYIRQWQYQACAESTGHKIVPLAPRCLPFVGHGLAFSWDIYGYIQKCYQELGPIFRLQIYRSEFLVVCDRELISDYFKRQEKDMSLYEALRRIYFGDAFSDKPENLETIIKLVKSTVRIDYNTFLPKIINEAKSMIQRLQARVQQNPSQTMNMKKELIRFVARTSAQCFISVDLDEIFFDNLMKFTDRLNQLVVLTYFMPRWLIRATLGRNLTKIRTDLAQSLNGVIESYRDDSQKEDSLVFRKAVDWEDKETGRTLTNLEIGEIVICLLYVSSENTALGLNNLLIDLAENKECADRVAKETRPLLEKGDFKALFANSFLDNCLMESARMNTHIFPINRQSQKKNQVLGDYWIGDTECVAICEPMLMKDPQCAQDIFEQPSKFNPNRYDNEPKGPKSIMTWGAGVHLCPGKNFAIYEMKTAVALLLNTFAWSELDIGPLEYFSPSAYAERRFNARMTLLPDPVSLSQSVQSESSTSQTDECQSEQSQSQSGKFYIQGQPVWLFREGCNSNDQRRLYQNSIKKAQETSSSTQIESPLIALERGHVSKSIAWPIGWQNLAYTGTSTMNCTDWLEWARNFINQNLNHRDLQMMGLSSSRKPQDFFDSVYIQLYSVEGQMKSHKDQHVSWGLSVSIGASCEMQLGDQKLLLHSGDVLICDFSALEHSVLRIIEEYPSWFNPEIQNLLKDEGEEYIETYGRARCSVQIRDLASSLNTKEIARISDQHFLSMLQSQVKT